MKTKALFNTKPPYCERGQLLVSNISPMIVLCTAVGEDTFSGVVVHVEDKYENRCDKVGSYATDWLKDSFEYFSGELTMQQ